MRVLKVFEDPKMFFDIYYNNIKYHHYAFLPLTTHVPSGNFENLFIGAFCYTENDTSRAAKEEVRQLYEKGFKNNTCILLGYKRYYNKYSKYYFCLSINNNF